MERRWIDLFSRSLLFILLSLQLFPGISPRSVDSGLCLGLARKGINAGVGLSSLGLKWLTSESEKGYNLKERKTEREKDFVNSRMRRL